MNSNIIDLTYSSDEDDNKKVSDVINNYNKQIPLIPTKALFVPMSKLDSIVVANTNTAMSCGSNLVNEFSNFDTYQIHNLKMMTLKGLVMNISTSNCFKFDYHLTSDQYQKLPGYDKYIHDCSEKALYYLIGSKPVKIWSEKFFHSKEYHNVHIPPYLNEFPLNLSPLKDQKNKVCSILFRSNDIKEQSSTKYIPSYHLCKPKQYQYLNNSTSSSSSSSIEGSIRLKQTIECPIRLPVSEYKPPIALPHIKWCEVESLEELSSRVKLAKKLGRMLIIVCSKQNRNLWEPKGFELWAHQYPRLMFASIDRDVANNHHNENLRKTLLGFSYVDGLAFVSHVPGEEFCRAFNANNIQTDDIFTSLKLRYEVANQTKVISALEHNGISSLVEINLRNALYHCYQQFNIIPLMQDFYFQIEDYEQGIEYDQSIIEVPSNGFTIQRSSYNNHHQHRNINNTTINTSSHCSNTNNITDNSLLIQSNSIVKDVQFNCYPIGFQLPLLKEQIKSIEWMLQRESIDEEVIGLVSHRAHIPIPPIENFSIKWYLQGKFKLSGGILADEMGFGKTACIIALITSTKKNDLNSNNTINKNCLENFIEKKRKPKKQKRSSSNNNNEQKLKVIKISELENSVILPNTLLDGDNINDINSFSSIEGITTGLSKGLDFNIGNRYDNIKNECPKELIPTNATLIIVPSHLLYQWENEIKKFTIIDHVRFITIANVNEIPHVMSIQNADIVLVSVRLFESTVYHERFLNKQINIKNQTKNKKDENNKKFHIDELYLDALHKLLIPLKISEPFILPLESYYWKRIVIDEIHELVAAEESMMIVQHNDINIDSKTTSTTTISSSTTNNKAIWTFPIKCLSSKFKWGLTGTPPLFSLDEINILGSLLGIHLGTCDSSLTKRFLDTFISSNCREICSYPCPIEKYVYLQLSIEEMALYTQKRFDLQSKLQKHAGVTVSEQNKAYEDILQHCSYFLTSKDTTTTSSSTLLSMNLIKATNNPTSTTNSSTTITSIAGNEIEKQMELKFKSFNKLQEKLIDLKQQLENCKQSIRLLDQDINIREDIRRSKLSNLQGRKEELLDKVKSVQSQHDEVQRSIQFFNTSIEQLRTKSKLPECPICMEDMVWGDATITNCGHLQCSGCIQKLFALPTNTTSSSNTTTNNNNNNNNEKTGLCATCRTSITMNDWHIIEKESYQQTQLLQQANENDNSIINNLKYEDSSDNNNTSIPVIKKAENKYLAFGTKIAYLVTQINLILQMDPTAKLLIYCQWDSLRNKLMDAFNKLQISYVSLEGRPETLRGILERFQSDIIPNASLPSKHSNIMLCSLELKAAGLNLQIANHIIFVHPFFSCNSKVTTAWEAQAIGRVLRPGQLKQVHIWRFIALDTVEQEILVKRNINEWKTHFT